MLTKIALISVLGTTVVGGTAATMPAPQAVELAAGTLRIKSGDGEIIKARMDKPAPLSLTIKISDNNRLVIKF